MKRIVKQTGAVACTIEEIEAVFEKTPCMNLSQAKVLRELIIGSGLTSALEIGTLHGKGAAFIAAIMEEQGRGHVTTLDLDASLQFTPNADAVLKRFGLQHRATVLTHPRSFTMTLMEMFEQNPQPRFDFIYFDGGKTWDLCGFAFLLADRLLAPGGVVVFDDLDFVIGNREAKSEGIRRLYGHLPSEEKALKQIRKVWEILVKPSYIDAYEHPVTRWGIARKPKSPV